MARRRYYRARTRTRYITRSRRGYSRRRGSGMSGMMPALVGAGAAYMLKGTEYFQGQNMLINAIALMDVIPGVSRAVPWQIRKAAKGYAAMRLFRAAQGMTWNYGSEEQGWANYRSDRARQLGIV